MANGTVPASRGASLPLDKALEVVTGGTDPADKVFEDDYYGRLDDDRFGGAGCDALAGFEGNDTLDGGAGDDRLSGEEGNDKLVGGFGDDTFVIRPGEGHDTVQGQRGNAFGEWLSRGDVDRILITESDWSQVRVEFTRGGFVGEVQADGMMKLSTNSAGVIVMGDQRIEFRGIERIQVVSQGD